MLAKGSVTRRRLVKNSDDHAEPLEYLHSKSEEFDATDHELLQVSVSQRNADNQKPK